MQTKLTLLAGAGLLAFCATAHADSWAMTEPAVGNCVPYMYDSGSDIANHNWGVINWSGDAYYLTCPIRSQVGLIDATTIAGVQIVGYDGTSSTSVTASLCLSNPTTGSLYCGSTVSSGASVVGNIAAFANAPTGTFLSYYYASVVVKLPARQCTDSGLLGCSSYRESELRSYNVWRQ